MRTLAILPAWLGVLLLAAAVLSRPIATAATCYEYDSIEPTRVGTLFMEGIRGVAAGVDQAYLVGTFGLRVIDVADPAAPTLVSTLALDGDTRNVAYLDGHVYITDIDDGEIEVVDVSDPANPVGSGSVSVGSGGFDIVAAGDLLYVVDFSGFFVLEPTTPAGGLTLIGWEPLGAGTAVSVSGTSAAVCSDINLQIVDVSDPTAPFRNGIIDAPDDFIQIPSSCVSVATIGTLAYVVWNAGEIDGFEGLSATDFSAAPSLQHVTEERDALSFDYRVAAEAPWVMGSNAVFTDAHAPFLVRQADLSVPGDAEDLALGDQVSYHVTDSGLFLFDLRPIESPIAGSIETEFAGEKALGDGLAYVAAASLGLRSLDVSDPAAVVETGSIILPANPVHVEADGRLVFSASGVQRTIHAIDFTDAQSPQLLGSIDPGDASNGIALRGDELFVAADDLGLRVLDVSDPASMSILGTLPSVGRANDVDVDGDRAYVASDVMQVVDVSEPTAPTELGSLSISPRAVAAFGENVLMLTTDHLRVIDVSDPTVPSQIAQVPADGVEIETRGSFAYVSRRKSTFTDPGGFYVFDLSDPATPVLVDETVFGTIAGLVVSDEAVFCSFFTGLADVGFLSYRPQCGATAAMATAYPAPHRARLHANVPNPFNPSTTIRFDLRERSDVTLTVHDVMGRTVATLVDGVALDAGSHQISWYGRDASGRIMPSGRYYYRLEGAAGSDSRSMVLVK